MATADQAFQGLQDNVNHYESTFQFFLNNEAFFSEVTNMLPAQAEQELGNQEANLITKVVYEVLKTLKPNFDTDLNTL
ncbi:hypothetical protein BG006_001052 [Podila minutissima]|uniref:Uncharacterized protein n=1 Tax=Podila minutissima TaxID=64525 RepID=A0A9P5SXV7_9FUNG|nr:hypothetical protein BG006_001052 [Podila minutissima]